MIGKSLDVAATDIGRPNFADPATLMNKQRESQNKEPFGRWPAK